MKPDASKLSHLNAGVLSNTMRENIRVGFKGAVRDYHHSLMVRGFEIL